MPYILLGIKVRGFELIESTTPEDVKALLGAPSSWWEDHTEHCIEYHTPAFRLRLYWNVVGYKNKATLLTFKNVDMDFEEAQPQFMDTTE